MDRKTFIQWIGTVSQDHKWRNFGQKLQYASRKMHTRYYDFGKAMAKIGYMCTHEYPSDTRFTRYLRKNYE